MTSAPPPDFAIVGAPKCGTTALYSWLAEHPGVAMSRRKEPCFWSPDVDRMNRVVDPAAYANLWDDAAPGALRGEASTAYLQSELAIPAILAARPDARLIAMIRNPVEMAAARHSDAVNRYIEDVGDFERAWRLQRARSQGRYLPSLCGEPSTLQYFAVCAIGDMLERFVDSVPEPQRLIILYDDFAADPSAVYRQTLSFLGLQHDGRSDFSRVFANRNLRSPRLARLHRALPSMLGPLYRPARAFAARFGLSPSAAVNRLNVRHAPRPRLRTAFEAELIAAFSPQIAKVEALLGRDLAHWRTISPAE